MLWLLISVLWMPGESMLRCFAESSLFRLIIALCFGLFQEIWRFAYEWHRGTYQDPKGLWCFYDCLWTILFYKYVEKLVHIIRDDIQVYPPLSAQIRTLVEPPEVLFLTSERLVMARMSFMLYGLQLCWIGMNLSLLQFCFKHSKMWGCCESEILFGGLFRWWCTVNLI